MDGVGKGFAPDQANELIVDGKLPVQTRGFGAGVDIEAAEEAVDALVGEAAFAQDANLFDEEGVWLGGGKWGCGCGYGEFIAGDEGRICGLGVRVRHLDYAFLRRRQFLPSDRALVGTGTLSALLQDPSRRTVRRVEPDSSQRRGNQVWFRAINLIGT